MIYFFLMMLILNHKGERNDSKLRKNLKKLINSLNIKVPIIILSQVSPGSTRAFSVLAKYFLSSRNIDIW